MLFCTVSLAYLHLTCLIILMINYKGNPLANLYPYSPRWMKYNQHCCSGHVWEGLGPAKNMQYLLTGASKSDASKFTGYKKSVVITYTLITKHHRKERCRMLAQTPWELVCFSDWCGQKGWSELEIIISFSQLHKAPPKFACECMSS